MWTLVKLCPTSGNDVVLTFALANRFILWMRLCSHVATTGNNQVMHFDVSFYCWCHVSTPVFFRCFILIFKQATKVDTFELNRDVLIFTKEAMRIMFLFCLTHWGQVIHYASVNWAIIDSDNGLSPEWWQIIWPNAAILLIGPLGINFNEILIKILQFFSRTYFWRCRLQILVHFVLASTCWYTVQEIHWGKC